MSAIDLRHNAPRRWSEENNGIRWLPRLTDKTRAAIAGTLGGYLYGQSPLDRDLLRTIGIRYREFTQAVRESPDDASLFTALVARSPEGIARARAWSQRLPLEHRFFLFIIDVDDGNISSLRWFSPIMRVASNFFTALIKRIWPSRATEVPQ